jgi:hypothetical protein
MFDRRRDVGIVRRERQRGAVMPERLAWQASVCLNLGQCPEGGQVLRRAVQDGGKFRGTLVEPFEADERAREGDTRGEVVGMVRQPLATDAHGLEELAAAPALFGELCESE